MIGPRDLLTVALILTSLLFFGRVEAAGLILVRDGKAEAVIVPTKTTIVIGPIDRTETPLLRQCKIRDMSYGDRDAKGLLKNSDCH